MATINPYLAFNGNCEEVFNFYKSVFGGEFAFVGRFKDMPGDNPCAKEDLEKIMHIALPISKETVLMGSDVTEETGGAPKVGDNITIAISPDSEQQARELYEGLSADGTIKMPLDKTFWGALFGLFEDKFGVNWMVNYEYEQAK